MAKNTRRVYREKICCNTSANKVTIDTVIQQEPVWLEPWWQQLYPGTCSWSWLAADTSSLACLWDTNTCSECGFECTRQPKGHWCAPSVSKCIRINQSVVMSRGGFLWVIQMAVKKGGVNARLASDVCNQQNHPCSFSHSMSDPLWDIHTVVEKVLL